LGNDFKCVDRKEKNVYGFKEVVIFIIGGATYEEHIMTRAFTK